MTSTLTQRLQRAVALRDAKPFCYFLDDDGDIEYNAIDSFSCGRDGGTPLYLAPPSDIVQLAVELGAEVERLEALFDQMRVLRKDEGKRLRRIAVHLSPDSALGIVEHELKQLADGLECGNPLGDCGCEGSCFTCGDCDRCKP